MPEHVLATIFNKYVTHAEKFNKVGAGLGLYLSKQIVQAHGGKIITKSFKDNQCIFGFDIPLEKPAGKLIIPDYELKLQA